MKLSDIVAKLVAPPPELPPTGEQPIRPPSDEGDKAIAELPRLQNRLNPDTTDILKFREALAKQLTNQRQKTILGRMILSKLSALFGGQSLGDMGGLGLPARALPRPEGLGSDVPVPERP